MLACAPIILLAWKGTSRSLETDDCKLERMGGQSGDALLVGSWSAAGSKRRTAIPFQSVVVDDDVDGEEENLQVDRTRYC